MFVILAPSTKNPEDNSYSNLSVSTILMMVLFYTESSSYWTQLMECLMRYKPDVVNDLLVVIAHGTVKARCPAVELLFLYWPELNPSPVDRKALQEKHALWKGSNCQSDGCTNKAVKVCMDHKLATISGDPPPMLVCADCSRMMYEGKSRETLSDILLPMEEISYACENRSCKSPMLSKTAIVTCYTEQCTNWNAKKPVRYCAECNRVKHGSGSNHVVHNTLPSPWTMESESQNYLIEAIVSLLKEAEPGLPDAGSGSAGSGAAASSMAGATSGTSAPRTGLPTDESNSTMALEERQLLSRYGVWLITNLCTPDSSTAIPLMGRLLSMLFRWFHYTACLPDDQAGSALERLKGECIHGWLMKIVKSHFSVFVDCLLPHPSDYGKVGGFWDCWPSQTNQIKEGFKQLLCLVPYDIITAEVWSHIMPYWMECFRHEIPEDELSELKILLSKVLDPDLSPLGLRPKQMYQFISLRFTNTSASIQEQALYWLQVLALVAIYTNFNINLFLYSRF